MDATQRGALATHTGAWGVPKDQPSALARSSQEIVLKVKVLVLSATALMVMSYQAARATELISNGGFEDGTYTSTLGGNTNSSVPVDWSPNAAFDLNGGFNHLSTNSHSGDFALSISNYDAQPIAELSQTFSDVAGTTYSASFYGYDGGANGDANADLTVSVGAASKSFGDTVSSYTLGTFSFVGTGSDTLTIAANTNPSEWYVDDVSVQGAPAVSAAPEPSTWLLMFAGIGGVGLMLRQAKRKMGFRFKDALSA